MSGKQQGAEKGARGGLHEPTSSLATRPGESAPQVVGEEARSTSHLRFKSPTRRDESSSDPASWMGAHAPSTLPPAPFEHEVDVSGHEWWLDAHMNAAANILCLDQIIDVVMDSADVLAVERVRAIVARMGDVRDTLYELYCDAADPRMHGHSTPDGPLTAYITDLYGWFEVVNERVLAITSAMRTGSVDWQSLASSLDARPGIFADDTRDRVRDSIAALGVDFSSHIEPLRNLPKDVEQMFTSAIALRDELKICLG